MSCCMSICLKASDGNDDNTSKMLFDQFHLNCLKMYS